MDKKTDMSTILNEIPTPVCAVKKADGKILTTNPSFIEICGCGYAENMIGQHIQNYLVSQDTAPNGGFGIIFGADDFVCDLIKADGQKIQVKVFSRPLIYHGEEAYAVYLTDLSKQQLVEKALRNAARAEEEASALKSRFLANISHEIRTPMNAIKGLAELLSLTRLNSVQDGYVRNIVKSANSLLNIINDVLDFSKINENKIEFVEGHYLLEELIAEVGNVVGLRAAEKGLMLLMEISPALPKGLIGDEVRVKQVMLNILNNALKYTSKGHILMRLYGEQTFGGFELVCSVEDTGVGIKSKDIPFLFEAFSQIDNRANQNIKGTGLGLSISDRLIRSMGGSIAVQSEYGKGSVFTARFPQRIANPEPLAAVKNPGEKRVLLLAQSERGASLARMLDELGLEYTAVTDENLLTRLSVSNYTHCIYDDNFPENGIRGVKAGVSDCVFIALMDMRYAMDKSELHDAVLFNPLLITELVKALALVPARHGETSDKAIDDFALTDTHILVVDDNDINLIVSGEILRAYKADVTCAESGQAALDLCAQQKYDLIFMDHMMPGMDGTETTIALRKGGSPNKTTPVIALTANVVNDMASYYLRCGMDDFIGKPLEIADLRRVLLKWLPASKITSMKTALQSPLATKQNPSPERALHNSMERLIGSLDAFGMYVSDVMREIGNDYSLYIRRMERIRADLAPLVARLRSEVEAQNWDSFAEDISEMGTMIHDVGARDCSGRARKLANAARARNSDYIKGDFFTLMDNMYMLEKKMEVAVPLALGNISNDVPFGDITYCYDRLMDMRNSLSGRDYEASAALLDSLAHYSLDHALDLILVNIGAKLAARDFAAASGFLEEAIRHCAQFLK